MVCVQLSDERGERDKRYTHVRNNQGNIIALYSAAIVQPLEFSFLFVESMHRSPMGAKVKEIEIAIVRRLSEVQKSHA